MLYGVFEVCVICIHYTYNNTYTYIGYTPVDRSTSSMHDTDGRYLKRSHVPWGILAGEIIFFDDHEETGPTGRCYTCGYCCIMRLLVVLRLS